MVPATRWLAVAAVAVGIVSAPLATHALPVHDTTISAVRLADRINDTADLGWSGEVSSLGSVQVPLSGSTFGGASRLLGERTDLRVWWRDAENWRIDRLRATGESDLVRDGGLTVRWDYEDNRVNFTPWSSIRLPDDVDVVPVSLALRLLAGATPRELSRLPAERVAGRGAVGLRLVPADKRSTISRVDVWADESSGLPLRVQVYGEPAGLPILSTEVISLDLRRPAKENADFQLSPTLDFSRGVALDVAAGANAFAPFIPPEKIAGLHRLRHGEDLGAVGLYGRGPTAVLAVPLRGAVADELRTQLRRSRSARNTGPGVAMEVGPLSVLLQHSRTGNFLLVGTVTPKTLEAAAADLTAGGVRTE
ncbi:MAG: hypothetical protein JWR64_1828 [Marmoricola sp.]|nr:hypothetical protein [Marmoricola sp.]